MPQNEEKPTSEIRVGKVTSSRPLRRRTRRRRAVLIASVALITAYALLTGPVGTDRYPPREASPYRLPWPGGTAHWCIQSNRGIVSHRGSEEFAYDFAMPVGSAVCAAREGRVIAVEVRHEGNGLNMPNNYIGIRHTDGTAGWYLHLRKDGALVHIDEQVRQGQQIGWSGNVGRSLGPHLHFEVGTDRKLTIPITFTDVLKQRGIPRLGFRFISGNTAP